MRISKGYWLWGMFSSKENSYLNSIKDNVNSYLKSPKFEIHLTLTGPYESINSSLLTAISYLSKNNQAILLNLENYQFRDEFYKSFFIKTNNPIELINLRKSINSFSKINLKEDYLPHISLAYGDHDEDLKNQLISKLPNLNEKILLSKIALVDVNEKLNNWKILKVFNLGKI